MRSSGLPIAALTAALVVGVSFSAPAAKASEWGCQVILCLASPGSPTQYSACVPPIKKLWRHLAKGRSFPSCDFVGANTSVARGYDPYLPCEAGYVFRRGNHRDGDRAQCRSMTETRFGRDDYRYRSYDAIRRPKPRWIELTMDGRRYGRHYY